jgi:hypothetical protein
MDVVVVKHQAVHIHLAHACGDALYQQVFREAICAVECDPDSTIDLVLDGSETVLFKRDHFVSN